MRGPAPIWAILIVVLCSACPSSEPIAPIETPTPVTLFPPYERTYDSILLAWSGNHDLEFGGYTLLRSSDPELTLENAQIIAEYSESSSVSHRDSGLSPGTFYYYRIAVKNQAGLTSYSNEIRASTLSPEVPVPEPPTPVFLSPLVDRTLESISLVWSTNEDEDFVRYVLYTSETAGITVDESLILTEFSDRTLTNYQDVELEPGTTHYYRVLVVDSDGLSSFSNEITATTLSQPPPSEPGRILLYSPIEVTQDSVSLVWSMTEDEDFANYTLFRSGEPDVSPETAIEVVELTSPESTSYVDEGLAPGATYYYRVQVENVHELSTLSNEIMAITTPYSAPPTPVTLHPAVSRTSSNELDWSTNFDDDFASYTVLRSDTPGIDKASGTPIAVFVEYDIITYTDIGIPPETTYYYRLLVTDTDELESFSNEIMATTLPLNAPEPIDLYPPVEVTMGSVLLAWSVSPDADFASYTLLRGEESGVTAETGTPLVVYTNFEQIGYNDTDVSPGGTTYYRVLVTDDDGLSALSNEVSATTPLVPDPEAPTRVSLFPPVDRAMTLISLMWSVNYDEDFVSYTLYRSEEAGVTEETGTDLLVYTDHEQVSCTDAGLAPGTTYYYRILVIDEDGLSSFSNELAVTTLSLPDPEAPTRVSLYPPVDVTMTSVSLMWSVNYDDDFVSYDLRVSELPGITEDTGTSLVVSTESDDVTHTHIGLVPSQTRFYRVVVTDTDGLTSLSNEISVTTQSLPDPEDPIPSSLYPPVDITLSAVELAWSVNADDDFARYTVLRSDSPGVTEASTPLVNYTGQLLVTHTDGGLPNGTTYYYRVMVTDDEERFSLSNEIEATTLTPPDPEPPTAVTLFPPYGETSESLVLTWTVNYDEDFQSYQLRRDVVTIPDEDGGTSVYDTTNRNAVLVVDPSLGAESSYYYRVVAANSSGLTTLSNEVIGTTLAIAAPDIPTPVLLGVVYNITHDSLSISWTQNPDDDFFSYELYRSDSAGVTTTDLLVSGTILDRTETIVVDTGLTTYQEYFYRVWVTNDVGESIASNEVSGITSYDAPPAPILLQDPDDVTATGMTLSWERSPALDFGTYVLYRSEDPIVDRTDTLVYETPDQDSLGYMDDGLSYNTGYYYRVYVVDGWGIATGSNIVTATTLNSEAPHCNISVSHHWRPVSYAFQFAAVDCEDNGPLANLDIRWDFGEGGGFGSYTDYFVPSTHTYLSRGPYWITLEVFDGTYTSQTRTTVVVHEMVSINAGTFLMGLPADSGPFVDAEPERTVTMDAFSIGRYEVTVDEYAAFLSDGNSPRYWVSQEIWDNADGTYRAKDGRGQWPATYVSWLDASKFCEWAGLALPTEAQWEYAARGPQSGTNYHFPWGNTLPTGIDPIPANFAQMVGNLVDVGSYANGATAWDLGRPIYDMAGNATEWVTDYYHRDYYLWANNNGDNNNPDGPVSPPFDADEILYKVMRGGGYHSDDNGLRVYFRTYADPLIHADKFGFRCVLNSAP